MKRNMKVQMTYLAIFYIYIVQSPGVESNASSSVSLPKPVTNGIGAEAFGNLGQRPKKGILTVQFSVYGFYTFSMYFVYKNSFILLSFEVVSLIEPDTRLLRISQMLPFSF